MYPALFAWIRLRGLLSGSRHPVCFLPLHQEASSGELHRSLGPGFNPFNHAAYCPVRSIPSSSSPSNCVNNPLHAESRVRCFKSMPICFAASSSTCFLLVCYPANFRVQVTYNSAGNCLGVLWMTDHSMQIANTTTTLCISIVPTSSVHIYDLIKVLIDKVSL
uniref:Uncharacterized protein n=1 Tax=Oryza brachyantha TaxID=4533 RepID=J3LHG8_ORYBR